MDRVDLGQKARSEFSPEILQLKPVEMSWDEFYHRVVELFDRAYGADLEYVKEFYLDLGGPVPKVELALLDALIAEEEAKEEIEDEYLGDAREVGEDLESPLYERLGGIFPIAAVVNDFSDALIHNPVVGLNSQNSFLRDWNRNKAAMRLPGLKFMRTLWLADISGGPYTFVPTKPGKCPLSLENAHAEFHMTPLEFDSVAQELARSLDKFGVPAREKGEVLAAFSAHKPDIILQYLRQTDPEAEPGCS